MLDRLARAIRRNHGLEHATVAVLLSRRGPTLRLVGRAAPRGFYLHGNVRPEEALSAAEEALTRLQRGERSLALSPLCGTNLAVGGVLAGVSALAVAGGSGGRWARLPNVLTATLLAVLASQPAGRWMQRHLTTSADMRQTRIVGVRQGGRGRGRYLKVETAQGRNGESDRPDGARVPTPRGPAGSGVAEPP